MIYRPTYNLKYVNLKCYESEPRCSKQLREIQLIMTRECEVQKKES
jgi:hypothetical protein